MLIEKPKIERVYVTIVDPNGEYDTTSLTVYETTPAALKSLLEEAIASKSKQQPKKSALSAK